MAQLKVKAYSDGDLKYAGYYDLIRRKPGDVFILSKPEHFSANWMIALGWTPPDKTADAKIIKEGAIKPIGTPTNAKQTAAGKAKAGEQVSLSEMGGVNSKLKDDNKAPEVDENVDGEGVNSEDGDKTPNPSTEVI